MKALLAAIGLCVLLAISYTIGTEIDPFEGIDLSYVDKKSIRATCTRQAPRDRGPTRQCVASQVAALEEYELMLGIYPNGSSGLQAVEECEALATDRGARVTDYVLLTDCAERKFNSIEASRLGKVRIIR